MQNTSNNPVLKDSVFSGTSFQSQTGALTSQMTVQGTMAKTAFLLLAVTLSAAYTWKLAVDDPSRAMPWMLGGAIGGFIVAMVISFKPKLAPSLAVPYALLEGLFLGAISALVAQSVPADSAVGGNSAAASGGGIAASAVEELTVERSNITRKGAGEWGGGLWLTQHSSVTLRHSGVDDNSAESGGHPSIITAGPP